MSNRIKKQENTKSDFKDYTSLIMGVFALTVLCLLPLIYRNYYYDILQAKYQFYCACVIGATVLMAGYWILCGKAAAFFKETKIGKLLSGLSFIDWAMIVFWLANVISWLCSEWRWDAFWGSTGRYNGAFLMTLYLVIYFLMTRFFHFRQWYLDAFLAAGILVNLFGITDYFQMDLLHFKERMLPEQKGIYTSFLGNINTYTVYVGATMVVSMLLFAMEKNKKRCVWYYINMVIASFALIMGASDNAYLTLAALFGLSPLYLFGKKTGVKRYLIALASFMTVIPCISWINKTYADTVLGIDSAFNLIAGMKGLPVLLLGLWIVTGIVIFLFHKKGAASQPESDRLGAWLRYIWLAVVVAVVLLVVFVFYDANAAGHAERYEAIRSYVVFDDSWGTDRGYIWKRSLDLYFSKFTPLQKIFGYGPDTLGLLMGYYGEGRPVGSMWVVYDSVHNEYIHYLLTIGFVGLFSYVAFIGAGLVSLLRKMGDRPEIVAVTFAMIAYVIQAVININIPIATPIVLTLFMMGLSAIRKERLESDKD